MGPFWSVWILPCFFTKDVTLYICLHVPVEFYPALCDSMGCSSPGFSVYGIFQSRILEVGNHSFLQDIFPTQGSNPVLLNWQVDSLPLSQGKPLIQLSSNSNADEWACEIPGLNDGPSLVCFYISIKHMFEENIYSLTRHWVWQNLIPLFH